VYYILNSVGEREKSWRTTLLIPASFDSLESDFINILFCVYTPTIAYNNVSGIIIDTLDFKISIKICTQRKVLFDFLNLSLCTLLKCLTL